MRMLNKNIILILSWTIIVIAAISIIIFVLPQTKQNQESTGQPKEQQIDNKYVAFSLEIYDKIKQNYWNKITHQKLSELYLKATNKITGQEQNIFFNDRKGVQILLSNNLAGKSEQQKKELIVNINNLVLKNMEPFGRSGLFSKKQAQKLTNTVKNIDPETDLYKVLGVDQNADDQQITRVYQQKVKKLKEEIKDPQINQEEKNKIEQKLALTQRAYETLGNTTHREAYHKTGIESTITSKLLTPEIFYIHIKKMSPTSFEEFQQVADSVDHMSANPHALILDLRDNVGGSVDLMQWFLGPFIGPDNVGYEFYHQGETKPFKTKVGWLPSLVRYKKVVILINDKVQSSGEVMAKALKEYNVGVLLGTTTKGWGTIEKIYELENQISQDEKYSMFLVHSLTLRVDNKPIEGQGVDPHINIQNDNWKEKLNQHYSYPPLIQEVEKLWQ